MFVRMLWRAALVRRGRALTALLAVAVAAAVATALLNLYVDAQAKLRSEFRRYGANIVVVAKPDASLHVASLPSASLNVASLHEDALARVEKIVGGGASAVPVAYAVARAGNNSVVVVGTDLQKARKMNTWWSVTPVVRSDTPQAPAGSVVHALIGVKAATAFASLNGREFELTFAGRPVTVLPVEILKTGAAEDSRIYLDLPEFIRWTGVQPSTIEVAVSGSTAEINATLQNLQQALPEADVRPVRQIVESEARVLGKTRGALLGSTAMVIVTAALCVFATLMSWVLDRRRDFAVMKALGASEAMLRGFFAAEAGMLVAVGAVVGFAVGIVAAAWIGRVNFNAPVEPRLSVLPAVLAGGIAVALLAALIPISMLRGIQPAAILRGE